MHHGAPDPIFGIGGALFAMLHDKQSRSTTIGLPTTLSRWALYRCQEIACPSFIIKMQLNSASLKFVQYHLDTRFNCRVVRAVAGDKLFNNGPQCCGRQFRVGNVH